MSGLIKRCFKILPAWRRFIWIGLLILLSGCEFPLNLPGAAAPSETPLVSPTPVVEITAEPDYPPPPATISAYPPPAATLNAYPPAGEAESYPPPAATIDTYPGSGESQTSPDATAEGYPGPQVAVQASQTAATPTATQTAGSPTPTTTPATETLTATQTIAGNSTLTPTTSPTGDLYPGPGNSSLLTPTTDAYPGIGTSAANPLLTANPTQTDPLFATATSSPTATFTPGPSPTPTATATLVFTPTPTPTLTRIPMPPWVRSKLRASDPTRVKLASGKVQLVEFFAFWSGACQAMAPLVQGLQERYQTRMNFVYLDVDDPRTAGMRKELGYKLQPQFFLLDESGRVLTSWSGYVKVSDLTLAIDAALK